MCGIVGMFDTRGRRPIDRDLLARMNNVLAHRGPDDSGLHIAPGIGLGHRRLSIIDLSPLGHQPLFNEDDSVCVTFNGEIYNYLELFERLKALGHGFRSRCDTEVLVHAWEEWKEDCVQRFNGMFAFAIWDEPNETLFLARDRFGEKPLYYTLLDNGQFLFGSELKALLLHPGVKRELDPCAVADYFSYGYIPDPRTIYRNIYKLAPAHTLTLRRGAPLPAQRQYWDVAFHTGEPRDEAALCEELVERVKRAVGMRTMADVPLGAFLSGGVDSSTVVAMMSQLSTTPVNTCSIAFDDRSFDESEYAAAVAQRCHTNHFSRLVAVDDFDLLDRLAGFYDEPFADSSALPTYRVCTLARERVTVALSGDGGDEVFAGYRRYYWHEKEQGIRSLVPLPLRRTVFGALGAGYPKFDWAPRVLRAKATLQNLARDTAEAYFNTICAVPEPVRSRLFSPEQRRLLQGYHSIDILRAHIDRAQTDDTLAQIQYADMKTYLPGDILTKVDRASMATALEVRVPLLDHELVQWAATIPSSLKLRGAEGKYVLKKAMEPYLSPEILYRPKMGFAVPLKSWFRGPLRDRAREIVTSGQLVESGMFDVAYLNTLVDQHQAGVSDHSSVIWSLMMFESFLRTVHGRSATGTDVAAGEPAAAIQP
jgi:asparagine synthase (glutamine-hydrolysing)